MRSGIILAEFVSPTPYDQSDMTDNIIMSDGVYVWDGIIIHWIEKYRIRLPADFIEHIQLTKTKILIDDLDANELLDQFKCAEKIMMV